MAEPSAAAEVAFSQGEGCNLGKLAGSKGWRWQTEQISFSLRLRWPVLPSSLAWVIEGIVVALSLPAVAQLTVWSKPLETSFASTAPFPSTPTLRAANRQCPSPDHP